jgi:hypothetical protein
MSAPSVHVVERPAPEASNCLRCGKRASLVLTVEDWATPACLVLVTCPGHYLVSLEAAEQEAARVYGPLEPTASTSVPCPRCSRVSPGRVAAAAHSVVCAARR